MGAIYKMQTHAQVADLLADGVRKHQSGLLEQAEGAYLEILDRIPQQPDALHNLGLLACSRRDYTRAIAHFGSAILADPGRAGFHYNLAIAQQSIGQLSNALKSYERAIALQPTHLDARCNLAALNHAIGNLPDAVSGYQQALALQPDHAISLRNLGGALPSLGRVGEAIECLRRALALRPDFVAAFDNLLQALNYAVDETPEAIFQAHKDYDQRLCLPLRSTWTPHTNVRKTRRRLRVGYVSPDFRRHSVRHVLEPLLAHHDHKGFTVTAYADLHSADEVTRRYQSYADHWVPTAGMSDQDLAQRIRADRIDILVDLAGHTAGNRLSVFARKPAPVSLSWLGYGYTSGLSAIDYFLTDAVAVPVGSEHLFSEQPWRLAPVAFSYRPAEDMGEVGDLPALVNGHVTFGTLTRAARINDLDLRAWAQVLRRVPNARLIVDSHNYKYAAMQRELGQRFADMGIEPGRVDIGFKSPPWDVLRRTDITLDCFPHNSGTTLLESLYMGVPFVTLAGRPSLGRLGASLLTGAGHPEWIAHHECDYVEHCVALASDLPRLATIRSALRDQLRATPLMDEAGFARKVESAYREMFRRWCEAEA